MGGLHEADACTAQRSDQPGCWTLSSSSSKLLMRQTLLAAALAVICTGSVTCCASREGCCSASWAQPCPQLCSLASRVSCKLACVGACPQSACGPQVLVANYEDRLTTMEAPDDTDEDSDGHTCAPAGRPPRARQA